MQLISRTKLQVERIFSHYIEMHSDPLLQKKIIDTFVDSEGKILERLLSKENLGKLFSKEDKPCRANVDFVDIRHPGYVFFVIISYLYYLNKLVEEKLEGSFGNDWRDKNIAYAVCVDKSILDNVFGSKEHFHELLYASGILQKNNEHRKAQISTYGAEILPAIQQKLKHLEFKMKSYFVVAQTYPTHIQLTLHQVVRLSSPQKDAATIIIQDEIIHIEDVYDTLCKRVWANMLFSGHVEYCTKHKDERDTLYDFGSFQNYSNIRHKLKLCITKLVSVDD